MKGQEYRNISLFFFPIIVNECIGDYPKEKKIWLQLGFMLRSCIIPTPEFRLLDVDVIHDTCKQFYCLYEALFGVENCTYNTHVFPCHLLEMRTHGPLTKTSAFGFEAFYGEIQNSFAPGTPSTLKQIFERILLKRKLSPHCCQNTIHFSARETPLKSNNLVYVFQDATHKMFKIIAVQEESLVCVKQGKFNYVFPDMPNLPWGKVGVYRKGALSNDTITIKKKIFVVKF